MSSAGLADGDLRVQCSALEGDGHDVQCVRLEGGNALRADHVDEPLACGKRTGDVRVLCWSSSVSYQGFITSQFCWVRAWGWVLVSDTAPRLVGWV